MPLCMMGVGFENTCTLSGKWNVSRVIWRLYWWVYLISKLCQLIPGYSLMVVSEDNHVKGPKFNFHLQPIFKSRFYEICVQKQWRHPVLWSWLRTPTLGSEFNYRLDGILIYFSNLMLWTLCGKPMSGRKEALFC